MAYSSLKTKTPLKAKTGLKAKTTLKTNKSLSNKGSSLKVKKSLRDSYAEKIRTGEKQAYQPPKPDPEKSRKETKHTTASGAYKPSYPYASILVPSLDTCYITGARDNIHIHHIFGAANKANSEKYHFLVPLRSDWHNGASYGVHFDKNLDLKLKRKCEKYWLEHYGTREEFIKVFGQWW